MKIVTLLFAFSLVFLVTAFSQSCLPDGITFTAQQEIDDFQSNFPNCTEIEGYLRIVGDAITNLDGLNILTSIGGVLSIGAFLEGEPFGNPNLSDLSGLTNLTSVGVYQFLVNPYLKIFQD